MVGPRLSATARYASPPLGDSLLDRLTTLRGDDVALADRLPKLRRLELTELEVDWETLSDLFESRFAPHLESLDLRRTWTKAPGFARFLTALARRPIAHLRLEGLELRAAEITSLIESGILSRLDALCLNTNPIGEAGARLLAEAKAPKLRSLELFNCGVTNRGAAAIANASWLPQLRNLDLLSNEIDTEVLTSLLSDRVLPELRTLRLPSEHRVQLSSRAVPRLVSVEPLPPAHARALQRLELKVTPHVSDTGIFALVESEHLAGMRDFNLRYPQVSQKSHALINQRFGFPQFEWMDPWHE